MPNSAPPLQTTSLTVDQAFSRATSHHEAGQLQDAERLYVAILGVQPDHADTRRNLGVLAMQVAADTFAAGRYAEAEVLARDLTTQPFTESFGWKLLGNLYGRIGRLEDALASLRKAEALAPSDAEVHNSLGSVLLDMGQLDAAMEIYLRAVELKPEYAEAHNNVAIALNDLGRFDAALVSGLRALELRPDFAEAHNNIGNIFNSQGQFGNAISSCRRALEIRPDFPQAYCTIGTALKGLGQFDEAIDSFRRAIEIAPEYAEAYSNLGNAQRAVGYLDAASTCHRRALEINPNLHAATWNLGLTLLGQGRYDEGWRCYEARTVLGDKKIITVPDLPFPCWHGEQLHGKSVLLWPEQGFGDYIQFVRYALLLKERGVSRLTIRCRAPLRDLLAMAPGVDDVITDVDPVPPHDYWSFPLSLPLHFGTTLDSIPATLPYLQAPPVRLDQWRARLPAGGHKVGLVWKGSSAHSNDAQRSLPALDTLRPLWNIPGITFVSLQKGAGEEDASTSGLPIVHLGSDIRDFADTAAIIDQLDLVICVDTAIAHVAGALGKPCWVLLPAIGCDWRWLRDRSDSPWYPHVLRLFRQKERGDWASVIDEVAIALRDCVG